MKKADLILSKNQRIVLDTFNIYPIHPTAQQVYAYIHRTHPKMGLTTVYRALDALAKMGKLKKLIGLDDKIHYDHKLDLHPHFVCKKCNKIMDVDKDCWSVSIKKFEHEKNVFCDSIEMNIHGVCSSCGLEK